MNTHNTHTNTLKYSHTVSAGYEKIPAKINDKSSEKKEKKKNELGLTIMAWLLAIELPKIDIMKERKRTKRNRAHLSSNLSHSLPVCLSPLKIPFLNFDCFMFCVP